MTFKDKLTHNELLQILDYNHLTGIFKRKISVSNNTNAGDIAGSLNKNDGYVEISINGRAYRAHILAWFYYYGYMPEHDIDHKDRIRHHNWILNLRKASRQFNSQNTGNSKANKSGIKGVHQINSTNIWTAQICINGKSKSLGNYKEFDNAVCARLAGEQCLDWSNCDSNSPAYLYVTEKIQNICFECADGIIPHSICGVCNGSGEGQYDGSTCSLCKGKGSMDEYCDCPRGQQLCEQEVF